MFDASIDAWYTWLGIAGISVLTLGMAVGIPTAPAPDAGGVADTIDRAAGSEYPTTAEHGLNADRIRLSPTRVSLRGPGGAATATFLFGPVTPASTDDRLTRVLYGDPPERVFDSPTEFAGAAHDAGESDPQWRPAPAELRIRTVHWEDERVTLVG